MSQETPFQDPFEFLKKMWAPMGLPMPPMVAPLLDPVEIDKRIADLKSVEQWLSMNMNVLRMTIQGLEMQKATLVAFQAMQAPASGTSSSRDEAPVRTGAAPSPADAWWTLLQQGQSAPSSSSPRAETKPEKKPK
jgi:hypothetical protein